MVAIALSAAQAGHLLAYQLRFGGAALDVQTTGVHWYFIASAKTALGLTALAALVVLFVIGLGRLAAGRRLDPDSSTPFIRALAAMYTVQLGVFVVQETVEAVLGNGHLVSVPSLLLWGAAGQLPVALVAALAWRWLGARIQPAIAAIGVMLARQPLVLVGAPLVTEPAAAAFVSRATERGSFTRRGPPFSF